LKKTRALALIVSLVVLFGLSGVFVVDSTPTTYPLTINDDITDWQYKYIASVDLQEDYEVYFRLTIDDPIPETDLDMEIYYGDEIVFWLATGYGYIGHPEIIEEGYFWAPYEGTYDIYMFGYWVPYEEGVDFSIYIDSAEEMYDPEPLASHGLSYGALNSYVHSSPRARQKASEKAPFGAVEGAYQETHINIGAAFNSNGWTTYSLTPLMYCVNDPIVVGGFPWQVPAFMYDSYLDAKEDMVADYVNYIDGVPLSELTKVQTGEVQKVYDVNGEVVAYEKVLEFAVLKPGELADLIGPGLHHRLVYLTTPEGSIPWFNFYFWLMPEGWTGPH
jgi:hypothetical protein